MNRMESEYCRYCGKKRTEETNRDKEHLWLFESEMRRRRLDFESMGLENDIL